MIYSISHFIVFSRKRLHWFQSRAPGKGSCFRLCLGGRGAAIARAKTGGAGCARGAASAAKPGSTASTACITGAETAALRGIVFTVEVAAAGAAAEAAGIAAPAGRAGVARGPTGDGITVTGNPSPWKNGVPTPGCGSLLYTQARSRAGSGWVRCAGCGRRASGRHCWRYTTPSWRG